ncbi:MAG: DUF2946 domain-containing protein [Pseudomonadota bacterium]
MSTRQHLRRASILAWLALIALVFVPTVSRLLAHGTGDSSWVEVCTPQGMKQVAFADDGGGTPLPDLPAMTHLDHCPLCGLGGSAPMLPPTAFTWVPSGALAEAMPALFGAAPRPLFAWVAAQPRGPPAQA